MAIDPILSAFGNMYQFAQSPDPVGNLNQSLSQGYQITTGQQAAPELERLAQMAQSGALPPIPTGISYIDSANLGASPAESAEIAASTAFNNLNAQAMAEIEQEARSRQGRVKAAFVHLSSTFPGMAMYGLTPTHQFEITIDEFAKQYDITPAELKLEIEAIQKQGGPRSRPHPSEGEAQLLGDGSKNVFSITDEDLKGAEDTGADDDAQKSALDRFNPDNDGAADDDGAADEDDVTPVKTFTYGELGDQSGEPETLFDRSAGGEVTKNILADMADKVAGGMGEGFWDDDTVVPVATWSPGEQFMAVSSEHFGARVNDPTLRRKLTSEQSPALGQFILQVAMNPEWNPQGVTDDPSLTEILAYQWYEKGYKESPQDFYDYRLQDVNYDMLLEADQKRYDTFDRTPAEQRALDIVRLPSLLRAVWDSRYKRGYLGGVAGDISDARAGSWWNDYDSYRAFTPEAMGPLAWFAENVGGPFARTGKALEEDVQAGTWETSGKFAGTGTQPRDDIPLGGFGQAQTGRPDRTAVDNRVIGRSDQPVAPFPTTLTNPIDDPYPFSVNR